uniref:Coiled-coil domain-containing protein 102A n=1 Tax=Romanomermis culicivorax TaxID=13658 RepID=A0A915KBV7_ROMCU
MSASTDRDEQRQRIFDARNLVDDRRRLPRLLYNRYNNQFDFDVFTPSSANSPQEHQNIGVTSTENHLRSSRVRIPSNSNRSDEAVQDPCGSSLTDVDGNRSLSFAAPENPFPGNRNSRIPTCRHNDWEQCEERRVQELEEAKNRAAQMEKTMKWWAECTANWRQKWSNIRDERNKYRDEAKQLKSKCENLQASLNRTKENCHRITEEKLDLQATLEKMIDQKSTPLSISEYAPRTLDDNRIVRDISTQCYISDKPLQNFSPRNSLSKEIGCNTENLSTAPPPTPPKHSPSTKASPKVNVAVNDVVILRTKLEETVQKLNESGFIKEKYKHLETENDMLRAKCEELEVSKKALIEEMASEVIDHRNAKIHSENAETSDEISFSVSCDDLAAGSAAPDELTTAVVNNNKENLKIENSLLESYYASCSSCSVEKFLVQDDNNSIGEANQEENSHFNEIDAEIEKEITSLRKKMNTK